MKEIAILSGKGGTGKSTLSLALFHLFNKEAVLVDADVDAPDLHLVLEPEVLKREDFEGGFVPVFNPEKCSLCGFCEAVCRFDAIEVRDEVVFHPHLCEGCGFCWNACPFEAIGKEREKAGEVYISRTRHGPFVHARLFPGKENSGKLVTRVRMLAKFVASDKKIDTILLDGPPGIGCPVISTLTGCTYAVAVTEPSLSALSDLERLKRLCDHFEVKMGMVINRWDLNEEITEKIEEYGKKNGVPVLGRIHFSEKIVEAMVNKKTIFEWDIDDGIKREVKKIWEYISSLTG